MNPPDLTVPKTVTGSPSQLLWIMVYLCPIPRKKVGFQGKVWVTYLVTRHGLSSRCSTETSYIHLTMVTVVDPYIPCSMVERPLPTPVSVPFHSLGTVYPILPKSVSRSGSSPDLMIHPLIPTSDQSLVPTSDHESRVVCGLDVDPLLKV